MPQGTVDDIISEVTQLTAAQAAAMNALKAYIDQQTAALQSQMAALLPAGTPLTAERDADFAFVVGDNLHLVPVNGAAGTTITATVPSDESVPFPVGAQIVVARFGAGEVQIAPEAGGAVTIEPASTLRWLRVTFSQATLTKVGPETWLIAGDLKDAPGVADPTDTSSWTSLFFDDSTKPLSARIGPAATVQGGFTWGPFSQVGQEAAGATGNYVGFEWTDGYATADPYNGGNAQTRRDDQTVVPNFAASVIQNTGYMPVERDTAAGVTKLKVRRRANTVLASLSQLASTETRTDGTMLGAMLAMQHALYGPPPYEIVVTGIQEPAATIQEIWDAVWTREADSHQSDTDPTQRVGETVTPGAHTEQDAWERTGLSTTTHQVFINHLYQPTTGTVTAPLVGNGAYTPDLGVAVAAALWDVRVLVLSDQTLNYIRLNGLTAWTLYATFPHPADSRFPTAPVHLQLDAKGGYRWNDNPTWVKSIDGTTPDWDWSFKTVSVRVPASNVANWTNHTIDPATIPAMTVTWDVNTGAVDNSVANGTVLADLTSVAGFTYEVFGCSGIGVVGAQLQKTGAIPAGAHDVTVWATRTSDGAKFVVGTTAITVLDNVAWWDSRAKVHLNFETQQVRLLGVAGTWATYVNADGTPTTTLLANLPGNAAAGVVVFQGSGAGDAVQGFYGYDNGMTAMSWGGSFDNVSFKDGSGADVGAAFPAGMTTADPFGAGYSWASTGAKTCVNGGAIASSVHPFPAATDATFGKIWNDGFLDRAFVGTKQRIVIYDPDKIGGTAGAEVSDAQLQAVAVHV